MSRRNKRLRQNRLNRIAKQKNRLEAKKFKHRNKRRRKSLIWGLSLLAILFVLSIIVFFGSEFIVDRLATAEENEVEAHTTLETEESSVDEDKDLEKDIQAEVKTSTKNERENKKDRAIKNSGLLESEIKTYLRKNGINLYDFGFVYKNLETGVELEINGDEVFLAASVMKVPINVLAYDLTVDGLDLDEKLTYYENDYEGGTGILQGEKIGSSYPISELLTLMITESDNVATNIMYRYLGNYNQEYLLTTLARVYDISSYNGNYITPNESVNILERIYYNEDNNPHYDTLLDDMKNTSYNDYFTRELKGIEIAHKTGDYDGYYNDFGIVYDDEPFIFAIFTDNLSHATNVLADIGKIVYDGHIE